MVSLAIGRTWQFGSGSDLRSFAGLGEDSFNLGPCSLSNHREGHVEFPLHLGHRVPRGNELDAQPGANLGITIRKTILCAAGPRLGDHHVGLESRQISIEWRFPGTRLSYGVMMQ
ncbi:MAG: hypothetical protein ACXVH5_08370, partial [Ilumatobacteraceae bacterium]